MPVQIATFRERLSGDPNYAISYIVANNTAAVVDRMRQVGLSVSSEEDIFQAINDYLADGEYDKVAFVLSVPMVTDGVDAAQMAVVLDVARGMAQAANPDGQLKSFNEYGGAGSAYGPQTAEFYNESDANNDTKRTVWDNVFGGLVSGWMAYWQTRQPEQVQPTPTDEAAARAAREEAERKKRTQRNIVIGVGIVVVLAVVVILFVARKGKK